MFKIKNQIEGQIQEIVFFFSLLISFSIFLSGVFFLTLAPESLVLILGQFGHVIDHSIFTFVGYSFFYLSVLSLHMGYITNFHVFSFKDFKREYPVLIYSFIAHAIILVLFSTLLSVIEISLEIPSAHLLVNGAGGLVGHTLGAALHSSVGVYGSILILLLSTALTSMLAGFFELPEVFNAIKQASKNTKKSAVKNVKSVTSGFQMLARSSQPSTASASHSHKPAVATAHKEAKKKVKATSKNLLNSIKKISLIETKKSNKTKSKKK